MRMAIWQDFFFDLPTSYFYVYYRKYWWYILQGFVGFFQFFINYFPCFKEGPVGRPPSGQLPILSLLGQHIQNA